MASVALLTIWKMAKNISRSQPQLTSNETLLSLINLFGDLLGISGWTISDVSIRSGLEQTYLLGRSQFLKSKEAEALGLSGATILIDGGLIRMSSLLVPLL
ncbi:hypothetical protein CsSME_00029317 [Camellia sinensis var. sinensis]